MAKYEIMVIAKPDLTEEQSKTLLTQLSDAVTKHKGQVTHAALWAERRKLFFPLQKYHEGVYYLLACSVETGAVKEIKHTYSLNENVLRTLVLRLD